MRHEGIAQRRKLGIRRLRLADGLIADEPHRVLDRVEVALWIAERLVLAKLSFLVSSLEILYRWASGDAQRMAANARQLVNLAPDVLLVQGANLPAARQTTSVILIVFVAYRLRHSKEMFSVTSVGGHRIGGPSRSCASGVACGARISKVRSWCVGGVVTKRRAMARRANSRPKAAIK
jgi:hypothetical protein